MLYKVVVVTGISILAILFPDVTAVMGFLGTIVPNLIFVFPNIIEIYVYMPRPGFGPCNWRYCKCLGWIALGLFICICGSYFTGRQLVTVFAKAMTF